MKQFTRDDSFANHHMDFMGKSYVFPIDRAGHGFCLCESDSQGTINREDSMMVSKAILGDPRAKNRAQGLDEEFSVELSVPQTAADLIWAGWDETDDFGNELPTALPLEHRRAREATIDEVLGPLIKEQFQL